MIDTKEQRNIYILTSAGWLHLPTNRVVSSGGIRLDTADIQELKALHLERERKDRNNNPKKEHIQC